MGASNACVLDGHGVVVAGHDVQSAVLRTIALAELARMNWLAASVGTPVEISSDDRDLFRGLWDARTIRRTEDLDPGRTSPNWRYFQHRANLEAPMEWLEEVKRG
jgi:ribulose-5-phosphate 4-epimerase/fuculose-1-phosphate aldolase